MGCGRGGIAGITLLCGGAGLAQAESQVFNQLREMSSTLVVAKRKAAQFITLFRTHQPPFDDTGKAPLQDHAHSLLDQPGSRSASKHLFADEFGELKRAVYPKPDGLPTFL